MPVQPHLLHHCPERSDDSEDEHQGLQRIGVEQTSLSSLKGVEPNQEKRHRSCDDKRNAQRSRDKSVEHQSRNVKSSSSTRQFAEEEKSCPRFARAVAKSVREITIDARELQTIIEWQKHHRHHNIAHDEAHAHLQIAHADAPHPGRHTHERHARDAPSNHAKSHHSPRRALRSPIESSVARLMFAPTHPVSDAKQHEEVDRQSGDHPKRSRHSLVVKIIVYHKVSPSVASVLRKRWSAAWVAVAHRSVSVGESPLLG